MDEAGALARHGLGGHAAGAGTRSRASAASWNRSVAQASGVASGLGGVQCSTAHIVCGGRQDDVSVSAFWTVEVGLKDAGALANGELG